MTREEYKDKVDKYEETFNKWCHDKWVLIPKGTMAVKAWIDFYYEVIENEPLP